ncbi:hypothetical protein [Paenibacillus endoradicis]|uniref:hypothetical protein n=1 Tax=Paenibacillus endoradicis TaxID=2972487 RepID=UPI002158F513|nr:hypothetical protein [Paenibacillus endoradicis]MCR8656906.1 hypothetical protein [Paenibacillus endoradicis]
MQELIGKVVQLIYIDSKLEVTIRNVKVLVVGEKRFKAYCYTAQSIRTFNVSGIVDIETMIYKIKDVKVLKGVTAND